MAKSKYTLCFLGRLCPADWNSEAARRPSSVGLEICYQRGDRLRRVIGTNIPVLRRHLKGALKRRPIPLCQVFGVGIGVLKGGHDLERALGCVSVTRLPAAFLFPVHES